MPQLLIIKLLQVLPLKAKSIAEFILLNSLLCGVLLYNAEKSYVATGLAAFRLPSLFKISITGLLF